MFKTLKPKVEQINDTKLTKKRQNRLTPLIEYLQEKVDQQQPISLEFVCTHNSRRSQFAQVWAQVAADYFGITINSFSGGIEVTACNERTVASLMRFGFAIHKEGDDNPKYMVNWGTGQLLTLFSKLVEDDSNPTENFAAIMTCSHADENCPVVLGAEKRIALTYEDPGSADDTEDESQVYDKRSEEIASDLFYVFSQIKQS